MGDRKNKRVRIALPVRVIMTGGDGRSWKEMACTLDISARGARLSGMHSGLQAGEILTMQRGKNKSMFRVVWVGQPGTAYQGQLGVHCVEPQPRLWEDISFPAAGLDEEYESDRRKQPQAVRYACSGMAKVLREGSQNDPIQGSLRDISTQGCYVRTPSPLPTRTKVMVNLEVDNLKMSAKGKVSISEGSMGMWIDFTELGPNEVRPLQGLIEKLSSGQKVALSKN